MKTIGLVSAAVWLAALLAGQATAQIWPAKPVKVMIPNGPGGAPDLIARMWAERMSRGFGQSFVVENNPAGAGLLAPQAAAKSPPDGYTFLFGSIVSLATNAHAYKSIPYDPARDFAAVGMLVDVSPLAIVVHPELPVKTLQELIAMAKAQPGKLSFAADLGFPGVVGRWMNKMAGTDIVHVPYKLVASSLQDVVSGRVPLLIMSPAPVQPFIKSGKLRYLALTSRKRFSGMEEVAASEESLPGFNAEAWFCVVAPAGTPQEIVQRLNRETDLFTKQADVVAKLRSLALDTNGAGTPQSTADFIRSERERWGRIMKEVGIEPQ